MLRKLISIASFVFSFMAVSGMTPYLIQAQEPPPGSTDLPEDLTSMGLDKLLNFDLVVTLPGRKEQHFLDVASAVYVITNEDIKRSGVTHVAEALRLAPGVNVARLSSDRWAISIRGFNQLFNYKLLVLIDGVSVFSPTTNGVYWESNELQLDDIDRIEVIRGPGASLWGSNAVNGVINIVTKNTKDTQGALIAAGSGSHEHSSVAARYGGELSEDNFYRLYATAKDRANNQLVDGGPADDDWESYSAGGRFDSKLSAHDNLTLISDFQHQLDSLNTRVPTLTPPFFDTTSYSGPSSWFGARSSADWSHQFSENSNLETRLSYGYKSREANLVSFRYHIVNLDVQHQFSPLEHNDVVYGASYRLFNNSTDDTPVHQVEPHETTTNLVSWFLQDEIEIVPDTLSFIVGSKFEQIQETGLEIMPNAKILALPTKDLTLWASVAKAVSPPAVFFEDTRIPLQAFPVEGAPIPGVAVLTGNRGLESESLIAYELGARQSLSSEFSYDVAVFYNQSRDIFSVEQGTPAVSSFASSPIIEVPLKFDNRLNADSYGGEVAVEYKPLSWFSLVGSYALVTIDVDLSGSSDVFGKALFEGSSPQNQAGLRAHVALSDEVQLDATSRYVDSIHVVNNIPSYVDLDFRLGWTIHPNVELALVGQNLLHDQHQEFEDNLFGGPAIEIERAWYGLMTVTF